jgi:hypothetical protein
MQSYVAECILLDEQRSIILKGIREGKQAFQEIKSEIRELTTRTYEPRLQYDFVNTHVKEAIQTNPHTQLTIMKRKAGFHPYIVIHDTVKNIFILVCKLPKNKNLPVKSNYRGEFASSNYDRLLELGAPKDQLFGENDYQLALPLGPRNQPFGIIIGWDGKSDTVVEGALQPDQEDWIYKEDITNAIIENLEMLVPVNRYDLSDIPLKLKPQKENQDIVVKLKNNTSS